MAVILRPLPKTQVVGEIPAGAINGSNVTFTTSNQFTFGTTMVYLNGQRLRRGVTFDYDEVGSTLISLSIAPIPGDVVLLDYLRA